MTEACSQILTNGAPLFCTRVALSDAGEILVSGPTVSPCAGPVLKGKDICSRVSDIFQPSGDGGYGKRASSHLRAHLTYTRRSKMKPTRLIHIFITGFTALVVFALLPQSGFAGPVDPSTLDLPDRRNSTRYARL